MTIEIVGMEGNSVIGEPASSIKSSIIFKGTGNILIIKNDVKFNNLKINFLANNSRIEIASSCQLKGALIVVGGGHIYIGSRTKFNKPCRVHAGEGRTISIGSNCLLANVRFRTSDSHSIIDLNSQLRINPGADIKVGDRVWIAEDVSIYKGVTIGSGSIVGSHAVVVRDVPENSLAVGIPARTVKRNVSWNERLV
jgi:acetyltransferase-like isoleucine patch superfamily enzyme